MFFSLDSVHVFVQCTLPVNISVEGLKARGIKIVLEIYICDQFYGCIEYDLKNDQTIGHNQIKK